MVQAIQPMSRRLNARRERLGISCSVLAKRVGISLRSAQRILSGEEANPGFATVMALARELGVGLHVEDEVDVRTVRRRQAERKAERMLAIVHGSSALEGQGMERETRRDLRKRTIAELLAGSDRRLWAE
jgi:transcriptional regulator with XRE-family HTH domain